MSSSIHHSRYKALQKYLREIRLSAGFTQIALAEALNIGQSYVSKIERGECYVDVLLFAEWCRACGVNAGNSLETLIQASRKVLR
jgi:transcriptional regulator with XRE-family HTH domain